MALPHRSIATINAPQFVNLQPLDVNPLMSSCEIKVLYIGENRNRSYISKDVATEMAKTLRGCPIVGYYKENKDDFADHGEQLILDDEGIHFNKLTRPYGFVAPDAKVWFKKFNDSDEFGNEIEREYLMTTGYLWTGQFEEAQKVLDGEGKPQSMELDENSLDGHWSTNVKNNIEFFIINDAIFSQLCILGDDVEPCFEGAAVTKPDVSTTFSTSIDDNFKKTLFQMMNELKDALKGGNTMGQEENISEVEVTDTFTEEKVEPSDPAAESALETPSDNLPEETFENHEEAETPEVDFEVEAEESVEDNLPEETFEKKEEEEEKEEASEEEDEEEKKKYSLLEQQYNELSAQFEQLKVDYQLLVDYKNEVENSRKDALIAEFYMLSDEDKKDVIENKTKYTLDEIKAKLSVIEHQKKVNFNSDNSDNFDSNEEEIVTFNYNNQSNLPDWVKAVKNNMENN